MKLAVLGATGHTGQRVAATALERGAEVVALSRRGGARSESRDRLVDVAVDVLDRSALTDNLAGCDAVVSALGVGTSRAVTTVYSDGIANTLAAMATHGIRRLSVISAAPVGPRGDQPRLARFVAMPILESFFGATYDDMRAMEARLAASQLDWVCLRPPRLVGKTARGYRMGIDRPPPRSLSLTYDDLATALLDSLDRPDLYRRTPYIAS